MREGLSPKIEEVVLANGVSVVTPDQPEYRRAAERLCGTLAESGCASVTEVADDALEGSGCFSLPETPLGAAGLDGRPQLGPGESGTSSVAGLPHHADGLGGRPVVALGNMMDSAFLRRLYFASHDLVDRAWPGVGGWVLRTMPCSLPGLGPVIIVGVSDRADVAGAVERFIELLGEHGAALPVLHEVKLGRGAELYLEPAQQFLQDPNQRLDQIGGSGDWDYMMAIARMGMLAVKTGHVELIPRFLREIAHFVEVRLTHRERQDPIMIHGLLRLMLSPFALLEHHAAVAPDDRLRTLEAFLALYRSTEGAANASLLNDIAHPRVRQNHGTRSAADLYYGGRYFAQAHGLQEGVEWMELAHQFFAPQLESSKPVCDSWGHQWAASLYNTAEYALMAGNAEYLSGEVFRQGVDRALMAHGNLESRPLLYLLMAAAVTGQDEYLKPCRVDDEEDLVQRAVQSLGSDEAGRSWVTGRPAAEPQRLAGLKAAPLARLFYDSIESYPSFAPEGVYRRDVPLERTFDKISFRTGWEEEDEYLLLDGISGGSHSYQDGNCIVSYTSRGHAWLGGPKYGMWSIGSVRQYNGVSVACDGQGPGCESRYARLDWEHRGDEVEACATTMSHPEQSEWHRHIIRHALGLFLVVDTVEAARTGEFLVETTWNLLGRVEARDHGVVAAQESTRLVMQHRGCGVQELESMVSQGEQVCTRWRQRTAQELATGEQVCMATLFWTEDGDCPRGLSLALDSGVFRVTAKGEDLLEVRMLDGLSGPQARTGVVELPARGGVVQAAPEAFHIPRAGLRPAWRHQGHGSVTATAAAEGRGYIGDAEGKVTVLGVDGQVEQSVACGGEIRAIAPLAEGGFAVGGDDETVRRIDATGRERWAHRLKWQPMSWEYWTRMHCGVVSLAVADVDADGETEVIAGAADRHVYCLSADGSLQWRSACEWGPPTCLELARLDGAAESGEQQVLVGMAEPAIHGWCRVYGADGLFHRALQRPDITSWSIPSWMRVLRVADVDDDGQLEVITGVDTNHRQLIVYRASGEVMWDADLGAGVRAVEAGHGWVYAGSDNGYVQCFDAQGARRWACFVGRPAWGVAPVAPDRCLVVDGDGAVLVLDGEGEVVASQVAAAGLDSPDSVRWWRGVGALVGREDGSVDLHA